MSAKGFFSGLGGILFAASIGLIGISLAFLFIRGAAWVSVRLLPIFSVLTWVALGLILLVILPLAIPRATRKVSSIALLAASFILGATLWMEGLLLTLSIWGPIAVFIGLFLAGVGVVPVAMLATLINGMWMRLVELVVLAVLVLGSRAISVAIAERADS